MKHLVFILFVVPLIVIPNFVQGQISFSSDKGWTIQNVELRSDIEIALEGELKQNPKNTFQMVKKMTNELVSFTFDEASQKIKIHLARDKQPRWKNSEWQAYLVRRSLILKQ